MTPEPSPSTGDRAEPPVMTRSQRVAPPATGWRRLPPVVWALTALWGALLGGASLLWPMTYGYDEAAQIAMSHHYAEQPFHFYDPATLGSSNGLKVMTTLQPGYPPRMPFADTAISPRGTRQTWAALGGNTVEADYPPNQMIQHPPLYYWAMAAVLRAPGVEGMSWDVQTWLLRLVSALMVLPVPALCYSAARRLVQGGGPVRGGSPERAKRVALLAALVPFSLANLVRDGASVNNDSMLILSGSLLVYGLVRVVTGDLTRRTGVIVAVAVVMGLMTKGFALVYPPFVLAAYLMGARVPGQAVGDWVRRMLPGLVPAVVGGVIGSWWWVRNLLLYKVVQTSGSGERYELNAYGPKDYQGSFTTFVPAYFVRFAQRTWGGIGLPDTPVLPPLIVWGWLTVALIGILAVVLRRGRQGRRSWAWLLTLFVVATIAVPASGAWVTNHQWSNAYPGTAGRYVYHLIVAISALIAVGWAGALRRQALAPLTRWVFAAALVTQVCAWSSILISWYAPEQANGPTGLIQGLHSLERWSPVSVPVTWLFLVVLPSITAVVAILLVVRASRQGPDGGADDEAPVVVARPLPA